MGNLLNSGVVFNEEKHTYKLGDKFLQGITWIISKYIAPNKYSDIPEFILEKAKKKGSAVHKEIELIVSGFMPVEMSQEAEKFVSELYGKVDFVESEYSVTDYENFASNIDLVDKKDNLYEIKTTSTFDEEYISWQLSIYSYMFELVNKRPSGKLYGIWLHKKGGKVEYACKEVTRRTDKDVISLLQSAIKGEEWEKPATESIELVSNEDLSSLFTVESKIKEFETIMKELKSQREQMTSILLEKMESSGIKKYEGDLLSLTYVAPTTRKSIDTNRLKKENPDVYDEYLKESEVSSSIRITIKTK